MTDLAEWLLEQLGFVETTEIHDMGTCDWANDTAAGVPCNCHVPAQKIADCESKRRLVELHSHSTAWAWWDECPHTNHAERSSEWCPSLRLLALPFADRLGYQPEWRP